MVFSGAAHKVYPAVAAPINLNKMKKNPLTESITKLVKRVGRILRSLNYHNNKQTARSRKKKTNRKKRRKQKASRRKNRRS